MIRTECGTLEVRGSKLDIMSDISVILHALKERGILAEEDIDAAVMYAKMSEDESRADCKKAIKESEKELLKSLSELLDDIISESESE